MVHNDFALTKSIIHLLCFSCSSCVAWHVLLLSQLITICMHAKPQSHVSTWLMCLIGVTSLRTGLLLTHLMHSLSMICSRIATSLSDRDEMLDRPPALLSIRCFIFCPTASMKYFIVWLLELWSDHSSTERKVRMEGSQWIASYLQILIRQHITTEVKVASYSDQQQYCTFWCLWVRKWPLPTEKVVPIPT